MSHVPRGPKKPVNTTVSEDLVREAWRLTNNLSETVETLLTEHVAETRKRDDEERRIDETIRALNEHEAKYGTWGKEYLTL